MNALFQKLGFQEVLQELQSLVKMENTIRNHFPPQLITDIDVLDKKLSEVEEGVRLLDTGISLIEKDYSPINLVFPKLDINGMILLEADLKLILDLLTELDLLIFSVRKNSSLSSLNNIIAEYEFPRALHDRLSYFILPSGELNTDANPELKRISKEISNVSGSIREKANNILKKIIEKGKAALDAQPTIINGRVVLPIFSEYKRQINGLIHDESASGQTTYLEPSSLLDLNNELRELEIEERRIRYIIYRELTDQVAENEALLKQGVNYLSGYDFVLAKSKLAKRISATKPILNKNNVLDIINARNPNLLLLEDYKEIIPFSLKLDQKERVLVLSGPNAGGKSVLLKTVGLFQLMLQSGMLIPVSSESKISLFSQVVADIGDDQSVQDELSTYTAHMTRMAKLLKEADLNTLFLLDEFGAGTDPESGGKIAAEILKELILKKSYGVVSTHYEEIKQIGNEEGCLNGAMQFDSKSMTPLFTLKVGLPGRSFAFEVAERVGVDSKLLKRAQARFTEEKVSYDEKLKELTNKEAELEKNARQVTQQKQQLETLQKQYQELVEFYQESKKNLLDKARSEVGDLLKHTKKQLDNVSKKRFEAGSTALKDAKQELVKLEKKFKLEELRKPIVKEVQVSEVEVGQKVKLRGSDNVGEVLKVDGQQVEVLIGELKLRVKKNALLEVKGNVSKTKSRPQISSANVALKSREEFQSTLDLRGMNGQEALVVLERYIDDALVFSAHEVKIIHGKGTGVLRNLVRTTLKKNKHIEELKSDHPDAGGDGMTIVTFA